MLALITDEDEGASVNLHFVQITNYTSYINRFTKETQE